MTLAAATDVEAGNYVHYDAGSGSLTVDQAGDASGGGGDVVANLGTGLTDETIKILFDDGAGGTGNDVV